MSFLSKMLISAPVNVFSTLGLGAPLGPVPSGLGLLLFTSPAGEGSDRVPLVLLTPDGSAFKLACDPNQTWRNAYDGEPVSPQHQALLAASWAAALNEINALLPAFFDPYKILASTCPSIFPTTNTAYTTAQNWRPARDPLVLDLDGGGISTVGINPGSPILFDHDGDGVRTGTGWLGTGEGILALDLSGNGVIDSGRELFGDNTLLANSPSVGQLASNGFVALAQHDKDANGVADGKIDSTDTVYRQLRIWQDVNQDAVSQATELQTLAALGIQNIKVTGTASNINLGGGNTQTWTGGFTRTNGATGVVGAADLAGSLLLVANNFYREFTDDPAVTGIAETLPQMRDRGLVRDLRPAMSRAHAPKTRKTHIGFDNLGVQSIKVTALARWMACQTAASAAPNIVELIEAAQLVKVEIRK